MYFSPRCKDCYDIDKMFIDQRWQQLGEKFKENDDVIIAKIVITADEVDEFGEASLFKLFQSGKEGKVIDYKGQFTIKMLSSFV